MKLVCPYCTREIKVEEAQWTASWLEYKDVAARLGRNERLAEEYAEHFRPRSGRMTIQKKVGILRQVAQLLETGDYQYRGSRHRADRQQVLQALRATIDQTEPPLKNHNYLKAILSKNSEKLAADGCTAAEEQERELRRRLESREPEQQLKAEQGQMTHEEARRRLRELAESIG